MSITEKEWILISGYLDEKVSPQEILKIESRRVEDPEFDKAIDEMAYTRRLLRALPQRRAPRNFTLAQSTEKSAKPLPHFRLQPALSFISVVSAIALVVIYTSSSLFGSAKTAAPLAVALEESSDRAVQSDSTLSSPVIINWNPILGMGGGGGGSPDESGIYKGGIGGAGGGVPQPIPESMAAPTEEAVTALGVPEPTATPEGTVSVMEEPAPGFAVPQSTANQQAQEQFANEKDLSTLILGLPNPADEGKIIEPESTARPSAEVSLSINIILMIITGTVAILSGVFAFLLRKR